jgi:hypothetical protein
MPVFAKPDAIVTITVDAVDYSCQLIDGELSADDSGTPSLVPVACGDNYAEPGDTQPGTLSGTIFEDFQAAGFTRILWEQRNTDVPFTLIKNPGTAWEASFAGTVTLKAPTVAVQPTKTARNSIELPTSNVTLAAAV